MDVLAHTLIPPTSQQVADAVICHLESQVYKTSQLRIAGAGRERCRPDYLIDRDNHPCFTLELVVSGHGNLVLEGKSMELLPGHIFLYGPGIRFTMRTDPDALMLKYFIEFFGSRPDKLFPPGVIAPGEVRRITEIAHFTELFEQLIATGKRHSSQQQEICSAYLRLILMKTTEAVAHDSQSSVHLVENLERCRSLIERNFATIADLTDLGRTAHLDPSYICRLFRQFQLPSPHRYLNECRMNRAVELLLTTAHPIKEIADEVGYEDPLHFSRNFRKQYGCPPSAFRETSLLRRSSRIPV